MKIEYHYKEYKDFPVATDISESRARIAVVLSMLLLYCLFSASVFLVVSDYLENRIICGVLVLVSLAGLYYLRNYYPKVTEKKIQKAISNQIRFEQEIKDSKYKCKYILPYDKFSTGTCNTCYLKNQPLVLCKIKNDVGTRETFICRNCIEKFKSTNNL